MYWRRVLRTFAIVPFAFYSTVSTAQTAPWEDCWQKDEIPSVRVQIFQTMLMVGAFKCGGVFPAAVTNYNAFVNAKRSLILANQQVVQAHFTRAQGAEHGQIAYLEHQTRVGNQQSLGNMLNRCESVSTFSRLAAEASEAELLELARFASKDVSIRTCDVARHDPVMQGPRPVPGFAPHVARPAAAPVKSTLPVETTMAQPGDQADLTEPRPAGIMNSATVPAPAASAPAPMAAVPAPAAPVPVAIVATGADASTPSDGVTAAMALQEAARALAQAATALQAQAAPTAPGAADRISE